MARRFVILTAAAALNGWPNRYLDRTALPSGFWQRQSGRAYPRDFLLDSQKPRQPCHWSKTKPQHGEYRGLYAFGDSYFGGHRQRYFRYHIK